MKTSLLLILALILSTPAAAAEPPTADQLIEAMDANMVFDTRTATVTMEVQNKRRTRSYTIQSYGRGADESAMEYLAPAREKGTRMLKLGEELWMYMPSVDRTQKISGHMLRQGMMGSDMSYEDMMTTTKTREMYAAKVTGEAEVGGRPCWSLELLAHDESVTYPKRVTLLDKETLIPLKQELYALSGMLMKVWEMSDVQEFEGGRKFPTKMVIRDVLKEGSETRLSFTDMKFGVDLEQEVFSMRWLERK